MATTKKKNDGGDEKKAPEVTSTLKKKVVAYRKDLILEAACEAFFENGYHECTVDMIAEKLSGTKAIVYYYFQDKHAILEEIYRRALDSVQQLFKDAIASHESAADQLDAMARSYTLWVVENQRVVGVFWREERCLNAQARSAVALEQRQMDDLVAQTIALGCKQGVFSVDDPRVAARAITGMISFIYTWWRNDKSLSKSKAAESYADMALKLVSAR